MTEEEVVEIEQKIVSTMISFAIDKGYLVSVHDGEEWCLKRSIDADKILLDAMSVDESSLLFRDSKTGRNTGTIYLVFGNGREVVCDHTDVPEIEEIVNSARSLTDE